MSVTGDRQTHRTQARGYVYIYVFAGDWLERDNVPAGHNINCFYRSALKGAKGLCFTTKREENTEAVETNKVGPY